jgi:hypothetical protein
MRRKGPISPQAPLGFRESRRCSRDTYPESYISEYILIYEDNRRAASASQQCRQVCPTRPTGVSDTRPRTQRRIRQLRARDAAPVGHVSFEYPNERNLRTPQCGTAVIKDSLNDTDYCFPLCTTCQVFETSLLVLLNSRYLAVHVTSARTCVKTDGSCSFCKRMGSCG